MPETELGEVEGANEAVDRPNRIVRTDIVLDPRRKQTGLLAALAALERAIRHKPNRTCCSRKCPQFLPSLDVSNTFAASKASCQRPPATLHGVVFHISVGSANRLDLTAQVVANAALPPHPCVTAPPLSLEEPRFARRLEGWAALLLRDASCSLSSLRERNCARRRARIRATRWRCSSG